MKTGKCLLLLAALLVLCTAAIAQSAVYPAKMRYNLKRNLAQETELIFHLELNRGWHVRVLDEGDTVFRSPEFIFNRNDDLQLVGNVKQAGIVEKVKIDSVMYDVYSYKVLYKQQLVAKPGTKISGKYTYQICNDLKCLPPKTERFGFIMK